MAPRGGTAHPLGFIVTLAAFIMVAAAAVAMAGLLAVYQLDKPTGAVQDEGLLFKVAPGETGSSVARRLARERVIGNEWLFKALMKVRGLEQSIKSGIYRIDGEMGGSELLDLLVSGVQALARVSVPEGASSRKVAEAAEAAGVASADGILALAGDPAFAAGLGIAAGSVEGYLFPDTYLLPLDAGAEALLTLMVRAFRERLAGIPEAAALSAEELHRRVILASIVEREYRVADEAPLMASVFWNRLDIGMALQSCATVVYVITERLGKPHPSRLFDRDLKLDDPFNTYIHPGLPPAPLCNPGLTAIEAAFRPASTDYLYFRLVDEETGRHYFSETLDEHIQAASLSVKPRSP